MLANLGFDCLILDVWCCLASGGTIVIPGDAVFNGPSELVDFLDTENIQHGFIGTARLERLLLSGLKPKSMATIITAGNALHVWPDVSFPVAVYNAYGPTEATVIVTMTEDLRKYEDRTRPPPIGGVLPGAEVWLAAPDGSAITTPSLPGEVIIGPSFLARGYRHQHELTEQAFTTIAGTRQYRTGDICQWTASGELDFLGRRDRQVKIAGNRVELAEVELAILRCPGVRQAAVAALKLAQDKKELHAWVEGDVVVGEPIDPLAAELPSCMVPSFSETIPAMPLTPNRKIDRPALLRAHPPASPAQ